MFKNFHNSLNSLEYQYSVHNSLLHLHSNFQDAITPQNIAKIDNKRTFQRILTHCIFFEQCAHFNVLYIAKNLRPCVLVCVYVCMSVRR